MISLLETALAGQGIWAILSVFLLLYVLNETGKREKRSLEREEKYIQIIDGFKEHIGQLSDGMNIIKLDVDKIKSKFERGEK